MTTETAPLAEITASAIRLLCREMGLVNTARFLAQFTNGDGDYTQERAALFGGLRVEDVAAHINTTRARPQIPIDNPGKP